MYRIAGTDEVLYEHQIEDHYEVLLNDSYPEVEVIGYMYPKGFLLRRADPIAFREAMLSYTDSMVQEGEWEEVEG